MLLRPWLRENYPIHLVIDNWDIINIAAREVSHNGAKPFMSYKSSRKTLATSSAHSIS